MRPGKPLTFLCLSFLIHKMIVIIVEGCRDGLMKIFTQSTENRTQSLVVGAYCVLDASLPPAPTYLPQGERGLVR